MKAKLRAWAKTLRTELYVLYYCARDPRVPWYAKAWIVLVVGYALSPFDLIPDFIPVIGLLDDLLIVPLGIAIAIKLVPKSVLAECRAKAADRIERLPPNRVAGAIVIVIWIVIAAVVGFFVARWMRALARKR